MTFYPNYSKCHTHPKYQGKLPPRCLCVECWRLYTYMAAYREREAEDRARSEREDRCSR